MNRRDFLKAGIVLPLLPYTTHTEQPKCSTNRFCGWGRIPSLDKYLKGNGLITIVGPCSSGKTAIVRTIKDNYNGWGCYFDENYWNAPVINDLLILGKTMHFPKDFFDYDRPTLPFTEFCSTLQKHVDVLRLHRSLAYLTYQLQKNNVLGIITRQANRQIGEHQVMYAPLSVHYHSNVVFSVNNKEIKVVKNRWGATKEIIKIDFVKNKWGVRAYERV